MIEIVYQDNTILAMEEGKTVGKIEFSLADREMSILHTYAYKSGRGIGSKTQDELSVSTILLPADLSAHGEHPSPHSRESIGYPSSM